MRLVLLWVLLVPPLPKTPVREVKDTYSGTTVVDPYRWLEDDKSPEVRAWLKAQDDHARAVLAGLPARDAFLARIRELDDQETRVESAQQWGGRWFYSKLEPGHDDYRLCTRETLTGPERVLVDPQTLGNKTQHVSMDWFAPSFDGKLVAYGLSEGGTDNSVLHIVDARTGKALPDTIDRMRFGIVAWRDKNSFLYARLQKLPAGAPETENFQKMRIYLHVLGRNPDEDPAVFGWEVSPRVSVGIGDFPALWVSPASPWVIVGLSSGTIPEQRLFVAPLASLGGKDVPWRQLADYDDAVVALDLRGDDIYLLTHKNAPRYKVIHTNLAHPDLAKADVVVAPSAAVVTGLGVARDALYVTKRDGAQAHLERLQGRAVERVALPVEGTLMLWTHAQQDGALVFATAWTHSPGWYHYDPRRRKATDTGLIPPAKVDFSNIVDEEVIVPSTAGAQVPLSILHQKGLSLDGSHPTLLLGYGSYGISFEPYFFAPNLAWLEKGGVLAVAHVRGGGEFGEEWHLAGMKSTKQHTVDDAIASAMYLVHDKYTSAEHLAIEGKSAGGLLVGGAITQHPELFGAAISRVGCEDQLRFEIFQGGPANAFEFGTSKKPEEVPWLLAMSPYHHVKKGTKYPAVLLTTGIHDGNVPVWQPAKMAARLQAATTSGKPILLRVDYDAGHGEMRLGGSGATKAQQELEVADIFSFLWWQLRK